MLGSHPWADPHVDLNHGQTGPLLVDRSGWYRWRKKTVAGEHSNKGSVIGHEQALVVTYSMIKKVEEYKRRIILPKAMNMKSSLIKMRYRSCSYCQLKSRGSACLSRVQHGFRSSRSGLAGASLRCVGCVACYWWRGMCAGRSHAIISGCQGSGGSCH